MDEKVAAVLEKTGIVAPKSKFTNIIRYVPGMFSNVLQYFFIGIFSTMYDIISITADTEMVDFIAQCVYLSVNMPEGESGSGIYWLSFHWVRDGFRENFLLRGAVS